MNRKTTLISALFTLAALPLAVACEGEVTTGEVLSKKHRDAYTTYQPAYTTVCTKTGNVTNCQQVPQGQQAIHHRECWQLTLRNDQGETGTTCVSPAEYDQLAIGQQRK